MRIPRILLMLSMAIFLLAGCASSKGASSAQSKSDSSEKSDDEDKDKGPKAFSEVIKDDFVKDEGLFDVYQDDATYYYMIPDEELGKEFLLVTRISKTADNVGYGGQKANTQVIRWDRRGDKVLLRVVGYSNRASEDSPIYEAVRNSNLEPIIRSFDIEAFNEDTTGVVIDVSSLFTGDIPALGLQSFRRTSLKVRSVDAKRSYIESIKSFPDIS